MNDLRPVALTNVLMKCFESIVKRYLRKNFKNLFDSMQFAYKENRCVDEDLTRRFRYFDECKLNIETEDLDIDFIHRIGSVKPLSPRDVLVKFSTFQARQLIYKARSKLKKPLSFYLYLILQRYILILATMPLCYTFQQQF